MVTTENVSMETETFQIPLLYELILMKYKGEFEVKVVVRRKNRARHFQN